MKQKFTYADSFDVDAISMKRNNFLILFSLLKINLVYRCQIYQWFVPEIIARISSGS